VSSDNPAAGMQVEILEILLDSHITDQRKFYKNTIFRKVEKEATK
jgi:hypothetical protein